MCNFDLSYRVPRRRIQDKSLPKPPPKEIHNFRLIPSIARDLKLAADKRGWSKTTYVQEAIRAALQKDGFNI